MEEEKKKYTVVYAVDFDGTLVANQWPEIGAPNIPLINCMKGLRKNGSKVVLWTNRNGELLNQAVSFCRSFGLEFDAVNDNVPELVEMYGNNTRKVSADVYIDDKSVKPEQFVMSQMKKRRKRIFHK